MEQEFLQIITSHQSIIHKVCRVYRDTKQDREDLFQEIVYQLWKAYPHFKGNALISTWMYKIALSTAVAKFRKKDVSAQSVGIELTEASDQSAEADRQERKDRLEQAIRILTNTEKAVITLYLEGYNYQEMAEITGMTENHIGVTINRIKGKLKKLLHAD